MLSRIVQLTEEAQLSKPKLQRWLDKFGEQYSRAVIILSASIALLGPVLFKWPFFSTSGTMWVFFPVHLIFFLVILTLCLWFQLGCNYLCPQSSQWLATYRIHWINRNMKSIICQRTMCHVNIPEGNDYCSALVDAYSCRLCGLLLFCWYCLLH